MVTRDWGREGGTQRVQRVPGTARPFLYICSYLPKPTEQTHQEGRYWELTSPVDGGLKALASLFTILTLGSWARSEEKEAGWLPSGLHLKISIHGGLG